MTNRLDSLLKAVRALGEQLLAGNVQPLSGKLPPEAGVYAIFGSTVREPIYVGESSNLRNRLGTHRRGSTKGDQMNINLAAIRGFEERAKRQEFLARCSFCCVGVDDTPQRLAVEGVLVSLLRPPLNVRVALTGDERRKELLRRSGGSGG